MSTKGPCKAGLHSGVCAMQAARGERRAEGALLYFSAALFGACFRDDVDEERELFLDVIPRLCGEGGRRQYTLRIPVIKARPGAIDI